jgi:hypothetical protein
VGSKWSQLDQLRKRALKHGCTVEMQGSGHWLVSKDGQHFSVSNTPRSEGSVKLTERELRKRGLIP